MLCNIGYKKRNSSLVWSADPNYTDSPELAKAKADYRADESIKEAGNALSAWITKFKASSMAMNWSDGKALEMAAQYAGLCADLHGRTASYYEDKCTNVQDAQKGITLTLSQHGAEAGTRRIQVHLRLPCIE